ncbi:hypothetical protein [Methylobacterium frigidaeris]|uniref:Uncharacterized protein n=1 Tax=Methylobacterium frigidaeris TaxID=2038277 RepID=A0AA37M7K9_9HYPH|nr:hypothetical protein [Methylobacterium frigidaeris]GJD64676.1 hypothetical protein MPEAHAMD_4861 [Methylobacterium frigidaeris]
MQLYLDCDGVLGHCNAYATRVALNELITDVLRHGALAEPNGRIDVTWWIDARPAGCGLRCDWAEHDGLLVEHPTREASAITLFNKVLTTQTGAELSVAFAPDGLHVSICMPLPTGAERTVRQRQASPSRALLRPRPTTLRSMRETWSAE